MNWKVCLREQSWFDLGHCPGPLLHILRKTTKDIIQENQSPTRNFNEGPPDYEVKC
jgi:hypothetical protein